MRANFDVRPVDLILTTFQATLLMLFNGGARAHACCRALSMLSRSFALATATAAAKPLVHLRSCVCPWVRLMAGRIGGFREKRPALSALDGRRLPEGLRADLAV